MWFYLLENIKNMKLYYQWEPWSYHHQVFLNIKDKFNVDIEKSIGLDSFENVGQNYKKNKMLYCFWQLKILVLELFMKIFINLMILKLKLFENMIWK